MKQFLVKLGLFFLILFLVDRAFGEMLTYMGNHAKGGYVGHHKNVTDKVNEDILIFGSSRAIHHYNPLIISDSLGMSCYNCGQDGNGIILFYGLWQMIKRHHPPKMIIYDVTPDFDVKEGDANQRYLGWLRSDYDRPGIKEIFLEIDPTEKYKMMSMLYRYNSKFLQNITDYVNPIFCITGNGFLPLEGEMDTMKIKNNGDNKYPIKYDTVKLTFISKFIEETKGIKLYFVVSPSWYGSNEDDIKPIKDLCTSNNIPFISFSNEKKYVHCNQYFSDGSHLNAKGADEFTKDLIGRLRSKQ